MALPKLNAPSYEMKVPSTGETVKFRPFLVKEQKMLMIAQESKDPNMMANTMCDLIEVLLLKHKRCRKNASL